MRHEHICENCGVEFECYELECCDDDSGFDNECNDCRIASNYQENAIDDRIIENIS